jgi:transcription antitermination factor NusG
MDGRGAALIEFDLGNLRKPDRHGRYLATMSPRSLAASSLPKRVKTIRHARKLTNVTAPLFPGYIFVQLDLTRDRWRSVNGTFGIASLIMQGERPHAVPGRSGRKRYPPQAASERVSRIHDRERSPVIT